MRRWIDGRGRCSSVSHATSVWYLRICSFFNGRVSWNGRNKLSVCEFDTAVLSGGFC